MTAAQKWMTMLFVGALALGATSTPMATAAEAPRARRAPGGGTMVVVDGKALPSTIRVELVEAKVDVVEYKSGNKPSVVFKKPGRVRVEPLRLEGTGVMPPILRGWWKDVEDGKPNFRKDVAVSTTVSGKTVTSHHISNAFPSGLSVDPASNSWTLTLTYDRVEFFQ